ncbi:MAG: Hsp20/alpha crystallin family protein [Candidatus Saccharimonadales bacterium]|nr:Hsp20/alpha crystallin family protein [Candidatus Saccharimonadales bacterium]
MARRAKSDDDDLLMEDELAAAFLDDENPPAEPADEGDDEQWDEDDGVPGQLAVDVYETPERLIVKARTAGVNKNDLDVSIADNTLTIRGTLSSGDEVDAENYHIQECYWGEFSRTLSLPVPIKEEGVEASLKDGVLTITFEKVKQDTVKKITIT